MTRREANRVGMILIFAFKPVILAKTINFSSCTQPYKYGTVVGREKKTRQVKKDLGLPDNEI